MVWNRCKSNIKRICFLRNGALSRVSDLNKDTQNVYLYCHLKLLPIRKCFISNKANASKYLLRLVQTHAMKRKRLNILNIPKPCLDLYKTSLSYSAAYLCYYLPNNLKITMNSYSFNCKLSQYTRSLSPQVFHPQNITTILVVYV